MTTAEAAAFVGVPVASVRKAKRILKYGVVELEQEIMTGRLNLDQALRFIREYPNLEHQRTVLSGPLREWALRFPGAHLGLMPQKDGAEL